MTIQTQTVGDHFGCVGLVRTAQGSIIHTTDVAPYGMDDVARARAEAWARAHTPTYALRDDRRSEWTHPVRTRDEAEAIVARAATMGHRITIVDLLG